MTAPAAPTIDAALSWLTLKTWCASGSLQLCMTENGDVGLFEDGTEKALGSGDTADEAIQDAHRRYHDRHGYGWCACIQLEQDGDALP